VRGPRRFRAGEKLVQPLPIASSVQIRWRSDLCWAFHKGRSAEEDSTRIISDHLQAIYLPFSPSGKYFHLVNSSGPPVCRSFRF
jgi:hypothetical protein